VDHHCPLEAPAASMLMTYLQEGAALLVNILQGLLRVYPEPQHIGTTAAGGFNDQGWAKLAFTQPHGFGLQARATTNTSASGRGQVNEYIHVLVVSNHAA